METLFDILAVVQILLGLYLAVQGVMWLAYAKRRMLLDPGFYAPRTAVICPCRGLEQGLERNLLALTEFDHQNYELFFVLASESDPATSTVKRVASQSRVKASLLFAGKPEGRGEKVNNLIHAVGQLPPEVEVLVFVDSDGRPGKSWLRHMVAPLNDARYGAATTMRWMIPNHNNFPTWLLTAWNAPIVTMLGEKANNFCWGGGTSIRKTVFEQCGVLEEWQHSISDDYSMTNALERTGKPILFLPECLTVSFVDTNFEGLLEFTNRQILITKVYSQKMWGTAFAMHALFCLTFLLGLFLTLGDLVSTLPSLHLAALTFLPLLLASLRSALRVVAVADLLPPYRSQINAQSWIYITIGVFIPFLYLVNFFASLVSRQIRWRGIRYELVSSQETRILTPQ
ncbi:MAG TPA: glycosyltransferase [Candidatus Dormibacteraeota bacterium]|nr:glycosyltransferase [Candidatus Dormibacteraeota bacterium]